MSFVKVAILERVKIFQKLTLIKESFFSLPWLVATFLLISYAFPNSLTYTFSKCVFLLLSFFCARLGGMSLNRLVDFAIDARNPRTKERPLQRGEIQYQQVSLISFIFLSLFLVFSFLISEKAFFFSLFPFFVICLYSFTKRFTFFCHFILGLVHFSLPIGVNLALTSSYSMLSLFLGLSLGLSIAANDIIYALQDYEFDRSEGLYSIPAYFGKERSLLCSRFLHLFSCISLIIASIYIPYAVVYLAGVFLICIYLSFLHLKLKKSIKEVNIQNIFMRSNTVTGIILLFATLGEYVWCAL